MIFTKSRAGKKRWLYLLPACQAFWINCHLSFVFGNLLLVTYLFYLWKEKKLLSRQGAPVVLALLVNLVNPHGPKGALAPFMIWENYGYQIAENQSIFFLANFDGFCNIFFFTIFYASNRYYLVNDREASFGWGGEKEARAGAEFFKAHFAPGNAFF